MKQKVTRNKDGTPRKSGSGRTKGSYSFVKIPLSEIVAKFADQSIRIPLSRTWAEQCDFKIESTTTANALFKAIQGETPDTEVGGEVIDLNEE
jgi:hypothetical protein